MHVCSCCGIFSRIGSEARLWSDVFCVASDESINQFGPSCHVFLERPVSPVPALPPLSYSAWPSQRHLYVLLSKPSWYSLLNHRDWFHNSPCLTWRGLVFHWVMYVLHCRHTKAIWRQWACCWGWSFHAAAMRRNLSSWLPLTASKQSTSSLCSLTVVFTDSSAACKNK